jgi:exosortase/archaeosortase family protein
VAPNTSDSSGERPSLEWSGEFGAYIDGTRSPPRRRGAEIPLWLRLIGAFLIFCSLKLCWDWKSGPVEALFVHSVAVRPAAWLIDELTPSVNARADRSVIRSRHGSINVINGCDGTEALFILLSALAVAPLRIRPRTAALLLGIPFVFVVNEARLLILFYANHSHDGSFEPLHSTVTPIGVLLLVCGYFYFWVAHADRHAA